MYFVKGNGVRPTEQSVLEKMQKDHLANMGAQAAKGNLLAAGPCTDKGGDRRGITVLLAKNREQCLTFFKDDPYVQNHLLEVAVVFWKADKRVFTPKLASEEMGEFELISVYGDLSKNEAKTLSRIGVGGVVSGEKNETYKFPTEVWIVPKDKSNEFRQAAGKRWLDHPEWMVGIPLYMAKGGIKFGS